MRNKNSGFTLSELLMSAAILAFVFSSLVMLFISSSILNEASRNRTIAVNHAQFALEEVKNTSFGNITSATWSSSTISSKGLVPLHGESINITVTGMQPKDVTARVNWLDRRNSAKNLSLETLITEP